MTAAQKLDESRARSRSVLKANALAWLAVLILVGAGLYWQDQRDRARQREICGLISTFDDAYRQTPPTTALGRHIAAEMHAYRVGLGC